MGIQSENGLQHLIHGFFCVGVAVLFHTDASAR